MWTQLFWPHNVAASAMNRMADSSWRALEARGSRTSRKIDNTGCIEDLPNQETPLRIKFHPVGNSPSSQMRFPWPRGGPDDGCNVYKGALYRRCSHSQEVRIQA